MTVEFLDGRLQGFDCIVEGLSSDALRDRVAGQSPMITSPYKKSVPIDASDSIAYNRRAISYAIQGNLKEAAAFLEAALRLYPDFAEARSNMGNVLFCQGEYERALAFYQGAIRINPKCGEAHNNLGNTLCALGRYEEALSSFQQALRINPRNSEVLNNLGNAYRGLGKLDTAVTCYRRAIALKPEFIECRNNLGMALAALNRLDEAIAVHSEVARLKPNYAEAYYNLGVAFNQRDSWDQAVVVLQQAIGLRRNHAQSHYCLGCAFREQGKPKKAIGYYREALRLRPDCAEAHLALATSLLLRGEFEEGWGEYEWRRQVKQFRFSSFSQPLWDGCSFDGRTILLHAEQGLGDTIQFVRYAPLVKQYGGTVIVRCQAALVRLLAASPGIDRLVADNDQPPAFDVHAGLLSLPRILKTSLSMIPADVPYAFPAAELQERWRDRLSHYAGCKIGIAWQGNPQYRRDRARSIPLSHFAPLARVDGIHLISLQKGHGSQQLGEIARQFQVIDLGKSLDETSGRFMDTAAVLKNLELVITSDTAIAPLAGAVGVPVWVALPIAPDWRWLLRREDSPWYPTMRLFRQTEPGDWQTVFDRMAEELRRGMQLTGRQESITIPIGPGELIDKITILEIKAANATDPTSVGKIRAELDALRTVRDREIGKSVPVDSATSQLRSINQELWRVEDEIRLCEKASDFGPRFIDLARTVYGLNDRRSALKRRINELLGSSFIEEKLYKGARYESAGIRQRILTPHNEGDLPCPAEYGTTPLLLPTRRPTSGQAEERFPPRD